MAKAKSGGGKVVRTPSESKRPAAGRGSETSRSSAKSPYWLERVGRSRSEFQVMREGWGLVTTACSGREYAEQRLREYELQEGKALRALRSGDPLAVCRIGWHQQRVAQGLVFFRVAIRLGDEVGIYLYRIAAQPLEFMARTIWCYSEMGVPWTCAACGQAVDA
jgi:hypothetical protein